MSFLAKRALFFWKSDRKCSCTFFRRKCKSDPKSSQASWKKFETEEFDIMADLKEAVYDTIEEKGRLDHEMIAEKSSKTSRQKWLLKKKYKSKDLSQKHLL